MRRSLAALLLLALAAAASGCSFIAVRRPRPTPPDAPLECTESRGAPVADTVGAIVTPLLGLMTWGICAVTTELAETSSSTVRSQCGPMLWITAAGTGLYLGSAAYGFSATGECRRLAEERRARGGVPTPPDR